MSSRRALVALTIVLGVALLLAWGTKARCLTDGSWQNGEQYLGWCYTDIYPLWFAENLHQGATPYVDHPVEYPVLIGTQMWIAAGIVRAFVFRTDAWPVSFFHVNVAIGAICYAAAAFRLWRMRVSSTRILWFIAAPSFVVYAFMNWDATAVLLSVLAIEFHRRDRELLSGTFAGLGAAAKLFPGFLVPIVVVARLLQRRPRDAALHGGAAAGAWLAVNLPVFLRAPDGWAEFLRLNRTRPADWDSLWFFFQQVRGTGFEVSLLNLTTAGLFLAGTAVIIALGYRHFGATELWRVLLPVVCWFLLTNKVYSPQFSIWLLPLMALALPRAPTFAAFAVADLFVFVLRFPFLGGGQDLEPTPGYPVFAVAIVVRAVILLWVIAEVLLAPAPPLAEPVSTPTRRPVRAEPAATPAASTG